MPEPTQDMGLVTTIIAEAVGEPGKRTFRLLLGSDAGTAVIWLEKEQLLELSLHLKRTIGMLDETGQPPTPGQAYPGPETPVVEFKLGKQAIEFDEEQKKIVLSVLAYLKDKDQSEVDAYLSRHPVKEVAIDEVADDQDEEMESWGDDGEPAAKGGEAEANPES